MRLFVIILFCLLHNIGFSYVKIDHAKLDNGMQVYVIENHRSPIVNHMVLYNIGGESSQLGRSGGAHYLEHLMFRGTKKIKDITATIEKNGGAFNASTSSYYTNYYVTSPKNKLELMMELEADRMRNLQIDKAAADSERKIVAEERRMRFDNNPSMLLIEEMLSAFYHNYYGWQIAGWPKEIDLLDEEEAQSLYDKFYHPNNAVLLVTGDTTLAEVLPLAQKYYGVYPAADTPKSPAYNEPQHRADIKLTMRHPDVKKPMLKIWYEAPNIQDPKALPLSLATIILANSRTSYLYQQLVIGEKVISVNMDYDPYLNVASIFEINVTPRDDNVQVDKLVTDLIDEVSSKGVDPQALMRAKKIFKASLIFAAESPTGQASLYSRFIISGLDIKKIRSLEKDLEDVTIEQVNAALQDILYNKHKVIGYLLPEEAENALDK